ncbi:Crp/Fnr family transcriptional regulator [Bacillus testis]|uniref:Crp/Fnr family transcriptional regulator n=1 Tax=Bacillus testis TaxID=1622072 RepID=UPI00067F07F9|nr:Crp/Fnr family transcriptional regulator [Bacillus testis]
MNSRIVDRIKDDEYFSDIAYDQLETLSSYCYERTYKKGQILFMEGDPCERFYYVLDGYVRLQREDVCEMNSFYCYIKKKTFFPYVNLFRKGAYQHTAVAVTDVTILYISVNQFMNLLKKNNNMLIKIIEHMEDMIDIREKRLQYILQQNAQMRVVSTIGYLTMQLGEKQQGHIVIDCPITITDIAKISGTSRETASSVMKRLRNQKIVAISSDRKIHVLRPDYFHPLSKMEEIVL